MKPMMVAVAGFVLSMLGIYSVYTEKYILSPKYYVVIGAFLLVIYFIFKRTESTSKFSDRLAMLSTSILMVLWVSSLVYFNWKMNIISPIAITKIIMIMLIILAVYINMLYFRGEDSYKKKRGNQRIKEEPKKGLLAEYKNKKLKKEKEASEIMLTLGISADNEDS